MHTHTTHKPDDVIMLLLIQSFYYDGKPIMSNEEFDVLKEELTWQGSKVAVLRCVCVLTTTYHVACMLTVMQSQL